MLKQQAGFTLLEILVAAALLAVILVATQATVKGATDAGALAERRALALREIDRVWILLENDLRNALAKSHQPQFQETLPALTIDVNDIYALTLIRAGQANPLLLPRTEVQRVAYRLEDGTLYRLSWIDPYDAREDLAREQMLIEGIEELRIAALPAPPAGRSVDQGPWREQWPGDQGQDSLPLAIEVTLELKTMGEIKRLIRLSPGKV